MCQPKPGPRCAAHTRAAFVAARVGLDAARRAAERDNPSSTAAFDLKMATLKFEAARADYETTPQGQDMLRAAIAQMEADGMSAEAGLASHRLAAARLAHTQQLADLALSRAYATSLKAAQSDPAVSAGLEVEAEVLAHLDAAKAEADREMRRCRMLDARGACSSQDMAAAARSLSEIEQQRRAHTQTSTVWKAALGHYGVCERPMLLDWRAGLPEGSLRRYEDGTYSLAVHRRASPGFPNGRLVPVVEVLETADGAKAFRLADQQVEQAWSAGDRHHEPSMWLAGPADRGELVATAGWDLMARA